MTKELKKCYILDSLWTQPHDSAFDRKNYKLKVASQKNGYILFSSAHKNGENHLFEIYRNKESNPEKKPDFIRDAEKLRQLEKKSQEIDERIKQLVKSIDENTCCDEKSNSTFGYKKTRELLEEDFNSDFEHQRFKKWYKAIIIRAFYESVKFMGYEHEWPEIYKMLPDVFKIPKEKMELYCEKGTIISYNRLFGELWSDKEYPNPFIVAAEMAHIIKDYKNQEHTLKLNPLQKEHGEFVEELIKLHLMKQMGYDLKRSSLPDKEIENIQITMRFGPEDPHAGYYESDLKLLEKIENSTADERRKILSYEGYRKWIKENAKTRKKRFFTLLNMLNVMARTPANQFDEQRRNIKDMVYLLMPEKYDI